MKFLVILLFYCYSLQNLALGQDSESYFLFNADKDSLNLTYETDLIIKTLKDEGVYQLTGEYNNSFEVSKNENNIVLLKLKDGADVPNEKNIFLSLDYKVVTTIVIETPNNSIAFDQILYSANYTKDNTIEQNTPIVITPNLPAVSFNLTGDPENENKIVIGYDQESGECSISLTEPLVTENRSNIILTLTAYADTQSVSANLVIQLPEPVVLEFSLPLYTALSERVDETTMTISLQTPIEVLNYNNIDEVQIQIEGDNSENFKIENIDGEWQVTSKDLNEGFLDENTAITFKLTASDSNNKAESVLAITLPRGVSEAPIFSQLSYSGTYQNDKVQLMGQIVIFNKNNLDLKIEPDSYTENFEIKFSSSSGWGVNVVQPLTEDVLNDNTYLMLTLIATENNNYFTGKAILVLDLSKQQFRL